MPTLETLPTEVLFSVLSFTSPFDAKQCATLSSIAWVSRNLQQITEEYARVLLVRHAKYNPKSVPAYTYRKKWIGWLRSTCQLCGTKSRRRAILDRGLTCCAKCDKGIPKITMTNATQLHHLSKLDLFTPNDLHPDLPPITFGIHVVGGCDTMMLSTPDVLERKQLIHGMLEGRVWDDKALKRRCANHERILEAMDMTFRSGRWVRKGRIKLMEEKEHAPQRLKTREARDKYVEEQLENERKLLGVVDGSADTAIDGRVKKDRIKLNKEKKHTPQGTKTREAQDNSVGEQLEDERKLLGVVGGSSDKAIDVD